MLCKVLRAFVDPWVLFVNSYRVSVKSIRIFLNVTGLITVFSKNKKKLLKNDLKWLNFNTLTVFLKYFCITRYNHLEYAFSCPDFRIFNPFSGHDFPNIRFKRLCVYFFERYLVALQLLEVEYLTGSQFWLTLCVQNFVIFSEFLSIDF